MMQHKEEIPLHISIPLPVATRITHLTILGKKKITLRCQHHVYFYQFSNSN